MAISYTSSTITFNDVKQVPLGWTGIMGRTENGDFEYAEEDGVQPFVNAVEIDWNGAKLGTKIINTSGELLSYISDVANNIPEVPADVITEKKLSAMGYITSSKLNQSSQNVQDWVTTNFVEKPTVTKIIAGVLTLDENYEYEDLENVILDNESGFMKSLILDSYKENLSFDSPFNFSYTSTDNLDADGNIYGEIKCKTGNSGYLYLVTVEPIKMNDIRSITYCGDESFSSITSNTLPVGVTDLNEHTQVSVPYYAYIDKYTSAGNYIVKEGEFSKDDFSNENLINWAGNFTIINCNMYIAGGTRLTLNLNVEPVSPPSPTPTPTEPTDEPTEEPTSSGTTPEPSSQATQEPTEEPT